MTVLDPTDRQVQARSRALADPTRYAIFAHVRDAGRPVTVAELTDHFELNHNAIRQHLAKLAAAGLVVGEKLRGNGTGRPPVGYRLVAGVAEHQGDRAAYERLSALLVELLQTGETPIAVGRRAGLALAAEHGGAGGTVALLDAVARRLGFEPHLEHLADGVDVVLDRCPFVGPAGSAPEIVCVLHEGIAQGIAEAVADGQQVADLTIRPPERAGCRIHVGPSSLSRSKRDQGTSAVA